MTWVLWFTISVVAESHILHMPMDDLYTSKAACEADRPALMTIITEQFPGDTALSTYCAPAPDDALPIPQEMPI